MKSCSINLWRKNLKTDNKGFLRTHADKAVLDTVTMNLYMTFVRILGDKLAKRLIG